jgi:hypothetical protein
MVGTDNSDRPKLTISIPAQPVDSAAWTGRDIPPMPAAAVDTLRSGEDRRSTGSAGAAPRTISPDR